ncbi:MAG: hypothetical protein V9E89_19110 [Ilumatobacteraceae bacterium]
MPISSTFTRRRAPTVFQGTQSQVDACPVAPPRLLLGRKKISEVRIADVEQFMRDVKAGKTAKDEKCGPRVRIIVKGGAGAATKGVRDLSALFTFAVRQELVAANPCACQSAPKIDPHYECSL